MKWKTPVIWRHHSESSAFIFLVDGDFYFLIFFPPPGAFLYFLTDGRLDRQDGQMDGRTALPVSVASGTQRAHVDAMFGGSLKQVNLLAGAALTPGGLSLAAKRALDHWGGGVPSVTGVA